MIRLENDNVKIKGSKVDVLFEFTMIARSLNKAGISRNDIDLAVGLAYKTDEELEAEAKKACMRLVMDTVKDFLCGMGDPDEKNKEADACPEEEHWCSRP